MTVVPLPESPCLKVRLIWTNGDGAEASSRFYLSYAGAAPTAANCVTLATDIASAWAAALANQTCSEYTLTEVDVLDIASDTGASGVATVSHPGTMTGTPIPQQVAVNIEFDIARRYRGGKPRIFFPPPDTSQVATPARWTTAFLDSEATQVADFFTAVEALSVGAVGALDHVNLSYYKGFTNITNSSGRTRAVPTYRANALVDTVTGYAVKVVMGSQRRRRTATTP